MRIFEWLNCWSLAVSAAASTIGWLHLWNPQSRATPVYQGSQPAESFGPRRVAESSLRRGSCPWLLAFANKRRFIVPRDWCVYIYIHMSNIMIWYHLGIIQDWKDQTLWECASAKVSSRSYTETAWFLLLWKLLAPAQMLVQPEMLSPTPLVGLSHVSVND